MVFLVHSIRNIETEKNAFWPSFVWVHAFVPWAFRGPTFLYSFYLAFSSGHFLCPFGDLVHQSVWYPSCCHLSVFPQFTFLLSCTPVTGCVSFCISCHSLCESPPFLSGPTRNTFAVWYWKIHKSPKLLQQWYSYFPSFFHIQWKRILKKYDLPYTLLFLFFIF